MPLDAIKQLAEQLGTWQADVLGKLGKDPFPGFSEQLSQYQSELRALEGELSEIEALKTQAAAAREKSHAAATPPPQVTPNPAHPRPVPNTREVAADSPRAPLTPSDDFSAEYAPGPETTEQLRHGAEAPQPGPAAAYVEPAIEDTPVSVVATLIDFAKVTAKDAVYNVGCGDGRLLVAAASKHNAHGVGIDPRTDVAGTARDNTRKARVQNRVVIHAGDPRSLDVAPATVVFLTLGAQANAHFLPFLVRQLGPGARIVTYQPSHVGKRPDEEVVVQDKEGKAYRLCLWRVSQRTVAEPPSSIGNLSESDWE